MFGSIQLNCLSHKLAYRSSEYKRRQDQLNAYGNKLGASPQLECWNIGKMGFGILECWVNGIIVLTIKLKTDNIL